MKVTPLGDNIIIQPIESERETSSGIVIPDTAKEKPQRGEVIAVGKGKYVDGNRVAPEVKKGDVVIYRKWGGNEIKLDKKEYLIVKEDDILGIIEA
jgi:chaperonin GroES